MGALSLVTNLRPAGSKGKTGGKFKMPAQWRAPHAMKL